MKFNLKLREGTNLPITNHNKYTHKKRNHLDIRMNKTNIISSMMPANTLRCFSLI